MATPIDDPVVKQLLKFQLLEQEATFRTLLDHITDGADVVPSMSELVLSTLGTFLAVSKVSWPLVYKILNSLSSRSEVQLRKDVVAIINGSHLVLPSSSDPSGADVYDILTLRKVPEAPPTIIVTVYQIGTMWDRSEQP